jgi:hypothetical protein
MFWDGGVEVDPGPGEEENWSGSAKSNPGPFQGGTP